MYDLLAAEQNGGTAVFWRYCQGPKVGGLGFLIFWDNKIKQMAEEELFLIHT